MVGDVHVEAEEFQEAVHAYGRAEQKAKEMDDQELLESARQKLKKAQVFLEQSKKKDYYKVSVSFCMYIYVCICHANAGIQLIFPSFLYR